MNGGGSSGGCWITNKSFYCSRASPHRRCTDEKQTLYYDHHRHRHTHKTTLWRGWEREHNPSEEQCGKRKDGVKERDWNRHGANALPLYPVLYYDGTVRYDGGSGGGDDGDCAGADTHSGKRSSSTPPASGTAFVIAFRTYVRTLISLLSSLNNIHEERERSSSSSSLCITHKLVTFPEMYSYVNYHNENARYQAKE